MLAVHHYCNSGLGLCCRRQQDSHLASPYLAAGPLLQQRRWKEGGEEAVRGRGGCQMTNLARCEDGRESFLQIHSQVIKSVPATKNRLTSDLSI